MFNFEDANKMGVDAMDTMMKSYSTMAASFQTLASEATDYSKKSIEEGTAAVEKLVAAKSPEKALEIQADYAKSSYEAMVAQATKMGEIYTDIAKEAYKPFEKVAAKATA